MVTTTRRTTFAPLFSTETEQQPSEQTEQKQQQRLLSVSWEKPLGMILEEVEEGANKGAYVLELAEEGSAAEAPEKDQIIGCKVATVMGQDVTSVAFDEVMDQLINAASPVELEFIIQEEAATDKDGDGDDTVDFEVGTPVTVTVQVEGQPDKAIEAKVGDNLRTTLQQNNVEVYRGLKAKLGNCGGGGQCGFCAVEFVDSEGWQPRSDYEDKKIKNKPNARLSCLNNIQGPVTIKM